MTSFQPHLVTLMLDRFFSIASVRISVVLERAVFLFVLQTTPHHQYTPLRPHYAATMILVNRKCMYSECNHGVVAGDAPDFGQFRDIPPGSTTCSRALITSATSVNPRNERIRAPAFPRTPRQPERARSREVTAVQSGEKNWKIITNPVSRPPPPTTQTVTRP